MKCVYALHRNKYIWKAHIHFSTSVKADRWAQLGLFLIAYAAETLHGKSPKEAIFDVKNM